MSSPTRPDPSALERVLDLLVDRPAPPAVHDGYLDLLGGERPAPGRIQGVWQSAGGSGAYDLMLRLGSELEERFPAAASRRVRHFYGVAERLRASQGDVVLDLGCGPGTLTRRLARAVGDEGLVVGIDISATMLPRAAAGSLPNTVHVRADAQRLPLRADSVDAACCSMCLQLLPDSPAALAELGRVLRPGGRIAVAVPGAGRGMFRYLTSALERVGQVRLFAPGELAAALAAHGFTAERDRSSPTLEMVDARKPA